ncbi:hypothetical protein, partial [Intestinimonas sp.]
VEIPDEDTPLGGDPGEELEIPDEDTPLGDDPGEELEIPEGEVPMGDLPQTGTLGTRTAVDPTRTMGMLALAASLAAAGLLVVIGRRKDEETELDD